MKYVHIRKGINMKLLLLTTDITIVGGVENVISKLTDYFVEYYGYEVEIVSLYGNYNNKIKPYFKFNNKVKLSFANLEPIPRNNKLDELTKDFKLKKDIKNIIKNREFDIIMTFHYSISIAVILNKRYIRGKIVVTEHGDYYYGIGRLDILKRKITYRIADKVVVLTEYNRKKYEKFLKNVEVINNPRPFNTIKRSNQMNKRIITAGRLEYEKGFDRIIDVFNDKYIKSSGWRLDIYGDGSQKDNLINKIKELNLEDKVRILPFTKNIKEEFLKSSIYVLPSRTEAFGMVLLEAMECGLPCISFDTPGPKEIIKNEQDGFIISDNNNDLFRDKLKILINDKEKRILFSKNSKKNVERFDIKNISDKWKNLFEQL